MDHFKPLSKSANCKSKSTYKVNLIQIPNTLFKFLLPRWFRKVVERVASRWRWWGEAEASARRSTRTSWSWPRPAALAPRPSSRRCRPQCPRSSEASSMLKNSFINGVTKFKLFVKWRRWLDSRSESRGFESHPIAKRKCCHNHGNLITVPNPTFSYLL